MSEDPIPYGPELPPAPTPPSEALPAVLARLLQLADEVLNESDLDDAVRAQLEKDRALSGGYLGAPENNRR